MKALVAVLGILAEVAAWVLVVSRRASVWVAMTAVFGGTGVLALLVTDIPWSPAVAPQVATSVGVGAGLALYAATRAFVAAARPWASFRLDAASMYGRREHVSLATALGLSVLVMVPGEELFWRGLIQATVAADVGWPAAAGATWLAYVAANAPSRNLAILAGAAVGGAVWAGLAVWTEGVAASLACHATWTGLMLAFPAVRPAPSEGAR